MSIALSIGNNLTTGGVFTADAVNNTSVTNVTDFASVPGGGTLKLLSTQTASASASISFTSGIDSTYDSYVFKFINLHPANDGDEFTLNFSTDSGSNYNVTKTTTFFIAYNDESIASSGLTYFDSFDVAQSTGEAEIFYNCGNGNDESASGELFLYNPSSTTFVKHFTSTFNVYNSGNNSVQCNTAGYGNTTSAINGIRFKFSTGNIDSGIIKMYGVV
jgi:hypothetical protein